MRHQLIFSGINSKNRKEFWWGGGGFRLWEDRLSMLRPLFTEGSSLLGKEGREEGGTQKGGKGQRAAG